MLELLMTDRLNLKKLYASEKLFESQQTQRLKVISRVKLPNQRRRLFALPASFLLILFATAQRSAQSPEVVTLVKAGRLLDPECLRVDCGGSWMFPAWLLRPATRERNPAGYRNDIMGFRVARTLP